MPKIVVEISSKAYEKLSEYARRAGMTVTDLVKSVLEDEWFYIKYLEDRVSMIEVAKKVKELGINVDVVDSKPIGE